MESDQACKFVMPFGKYAGNSLEWIATSDPDGPRYLDWMVGLDNLSPDFKEALECFLAIHWVKELVERYVKDHRSGIRSEPVENKKIPGPWWKQ